MAEFAVCDLHHQVLKCWTEVRKKINSPVRVITLDYHTDTMPCFRHELPPPQYGDWQDEKILQHALKNLRHDEHFDWAVCAGIISGADILAYFPPYQKPENPLLNVISPPEFPEADIILNQPEKFRHMAEKVISTPFLLKHLESVLPKDGEPYIFDIDCDYFLCRKALENPDNQLFVKLLHNALAVTVSLENDWVKILKLPGETLTGSETALILQRDFI